MQVDADKHRSLGERFGVKGFPTVLYLARGKPVDKHETCDATAPPPPPPRVPPAPTPSYIRNRACPFRTAPGICVSALISPSAKRHHPLPSLAAASFILRLLAGSLVWRCGAPAPHYCTLEGRGVLETVNWISGARTVCSHCRLDLDRMPRGLPSSSVGLLPLLPIAVVCDPYHRIMIACISNRHAPLQL